MYKAGWKKYVVVFIITAGIFAVGFYASDYLNNKKLESIKSIQDKISTDILSSETQFSLLQEIPCADVSNSILSQELNILSDKINYSEKNFTGNSDEITSLKKDYSLLEIKDYLLLKEASKRCGLKPVFLFYFYIRGDVCTECTREDDVLSKLRDTYPEVRIYSFDYNLDLSAVKAFVSIYKVPEIFPGFVINGKSYTGGKSFEEIEAIIKPLIAKNAPKKVITTVKKEDSTTPLDTTITPPAVDTNTGQPNTTNDATETQ